MKANVTFIGLLAGHFSNCLRVSRRMVTPFSSRSTVSEPAKESVERLVVERNRLVTVVV